MEKKDLLKNSVVRYLVANKKLKLLAGFKLKKNVNAFLKEIKKCYPGLKWDVTPILKNLTLVGVGK